MKKITRDNINNSPYPIDTGRQIRIGENQNSIKVALCGDSTIDNGYWVNRNVDYHSKTDTVAYQTALSLAQKNNDNTYDLANFAVDGATTTSMLSSQKFDQVISKDEDHPAIDVKQLIEINKWSPEVAILSVGGNNYRLTLQTELRNALIPGSNHNIFLYYCSLISILCRFTPKDKFIRMDISQLFDTTYNQLIGEYKQIIDKLLENQSIKRLVISSQYYPALTPATFYFIYTGFSQLAHAQGSRQSGFQIAETILHKLYHDVLAYAATKNIEIVFADVTSSLSPLSHHLSSQIEPNAKGSKILGQLMAEAIELEIPPEKKQNSIPIIRLNQKQEFEIQYLQKEHKDQLKLKTIEEFIQQERYAHIKLLFAKDTPILSRFICFYEFLAGKQFDNEYQGLFAFGLLDLSLVTIAASYLWRITLNENMHFLIRMTSGMISGPILIIKHIIALLLVLITLLTMILMVQIMNQFQKLGVSLKNYPLQWIQKTSTNDETSKESLNNFTR